MIPYEIEVFIIKQEEFKPHKQCRLILKKYCYQIFFLDFELYINKTENKKNIDLLSMFFLFSVLLSLKCLDPAWNFI